MPEPRRGADGARGGRGSSLLSSFRGREGRPRPRRGRPGAWPSLPGRHRTRRRRRRAPPRRRRGCRRRRRHRRNLPVSRQNQNLRIASGPGVPAPPPAPPRRRRRSSPSTPPPRPWQRGLCMLLLFTPPEGASPPAPFARERPALRLGRRGEHHGPDGGEVRLEPWASAVRAAGHSGAKRTCRTPTRRAPPTDRARRKARRRRRRGRRRRKARKQRARGRSPRRRARRRRRRPCPSRRRGRRPARSARARQRPLARCQRPRAWQPRARGGLPSGGGPRG